MLHYSTARFLLRCHPMLQFLFRAPALEVLRRASGYLQ